MTNPKFDVAIVADGNEKIGMGHIMRTSAIADAICALGYSVCYIVSGSASREALSGMGYECFCINAEYTILSLQAESIRTVADAYGVKLLFFDSYYASDELFLSLRRSFKIGCFGYGKKYSEGMDVIVPYGVGADKEWYKRRFSDMKTRVLLGSEYVPLKRTFWDSVKKEVGLPPKKLLITSGATDPYNICGELLKAIEEHSILKNMEKNVVVGRYFDRAKLLNCVHEHDVLYENIADLSGLMRECDIAVSAAGTTVYELMALGVPTVVYAFADNQLGNAALDGAIVWCGDLRSTDVINASSVAKTVDALGQLVLNTEKRQALSLRGIERCDGKGAKRIADEIAKLIHFG